jgi:threonine dehydrogenase-like Zn-dependent dehydrogenase
LNAIPVSYKESDLLEFALGPQPILKLIAREAATLKIDFIGATPDFFVTGCGPRGCLFCQALKRCCAKR